MIFALHDTENVGSVMSTCHKLSERNVKAEKGKHAQAAREKADERAAKRQATLAAGVPPLPGNEELAQHRHCDCGYDLATCRACGNGWQQILDREYPAGASDADGERRRPSKSKGPWDEAMGDVVAMGGVPQELLVVNMRQIAVANRKQRERLADRQCAIRASGKWSGHRLRQVPELLHPRRTKVCLHQSSGKVHQRPLWCKDQAAQDEYHPV